MADEEQPPLPLPLVDSFTDPPNPGATPPGDLGNLVDIMSGQTPTPQMATSLEELTLGPLNAPVRFGAPPPPPPGQGWRFDPEGAAKIINKIDDIIENRLREFRQKARMLHSIKPPGHDPVSKQTIATFNRSGLEYVAFLDSMIARLKWFRDQLEAVRDGKMRDDQDGAAGWDKA